MQVYRVQDKDGRGPFKPGFSTSWFEPRPDHQYLLPFYQQFGSIDLFSPAGHLGCGCLTIEQLKRWFSLGEMTTLEKYGYKAVKINCTKIIAWSDIQCVFECAEPINKNAEIFDLYGNN